MLETFASISEYLTWICWEIIAVGLPTKCFPRQLREKAREYIQPQTFAWHPIGYNQEHGFTIKYAPAYYLAALGAHFSSMSLTMSYRFLPLGSDTASETLGYHNLPIRKASTFAF
jgi:hypothetical protein